MPRSTRASSRPSPSPGPPPSPRALRAASRATSVAPLPSIEEDDMAPRARARPSPTPFRPTIPVAVSAGYGSPGKLGSPSRRIRAQAQTGGDLAADVGPRLARLSEEPGRVDDEPVTEEEVVVPVVEKKRTEKGKGMKNATGNESFGVEAEVGRSAAVEVAPVVAPVFTPITVPARKSVAPVEEVVPGSVPAWTNLRTVVIFLAFWLLLSPLLAGLLSLTRDVPWLATTKSLVTFGAFPASPHFGTSYPGEFAPNIDMHALRAGLAATSDLASFRQEVSNDIDGIHNDMSHLRVQVNSLSSSVPAKGASTHFLGGLPAHIIPSHGASRVNLFSTNFGTVIDPYLTSPSRAETIHYENYILRWLYPKGETIPLTYSPVEALNAWEDLGDCWCTPNSDPDSSDADSTNGLAQIAMILTQPIIPTDIVIEHIERDRTIDSDSTPKEFELLIQVHDHDIREQIKTAAKNWLPAGDWHVTPQQESHRWQAERQLDETWVKVGRWQYDLHSAQNVQSFRIPMWLGAFGDFGVSKVVVRTRSNWGNAPYTCLYRLKMFGQIVKEK